MDSKLFLSMILLSSWVYLGFSQPAIPSGLENCVKSLVPCQAYLKSSSPPSTCCVPLKDMFTNDPKCLCDMFSNKDFLKELNLSEEDALKLPKTCGVPADQVDVSKCKLVEGPPGSSSATPSAPATSNGTDHDSSTDASSKKSSADGLTPFSGLRFLATVVALVSAAF